MSNDTQVVHGNYEDKYNTRNLIARRMVEGFFSAFNSMLHSFPAEDISRVCEVGCAEGELLKRMYSVFPTAVLFATDISQIEIEKARENCRALPVTFSVQNAETLREYGDDQFDLVVCSEVLEHLVNPEQGLRELHRICREYLLISVPHEPIWRVLNMCRRKYLREFGNTPGHLNHWSRAGLTKFLARETGFTVTRRLYPFPWQMILLEKRGLYGD